MKRKKRYKLVKAVVRDWYTIDFVAFNKPAKEVIKSEELRTLWNAYKVALLKDHYERNGVPWDVKVGEPIVDAAVLARRARQMGVSTFKRKLNEGKFSKLLPKKAKILLVRESLGHLVGTINEHIDNLCKVLYACMK